MPRKRFKKLRVSKDVKKFVKKAIADEPEKKTYLTRQTSAFNGVVNNDVGAFQSLTTMAQGSADSERIGDAIKPASLEVRVRAVSQMNATGDVTAGALVGGGLPCSVRVLVFCDKDVSAGAPVVGSLYALNGTADFIAPYNIVNVPNRFTILADRIIDLESPGYAAASASGPKTIRFKVKNLPSKIFYNGATAGKNEIQTLITSNRTDATAIEPYVDLSTTLKYTDC